MDEAFTGPLVAEPVQDHRQPKKKSKHKSQTVVENFAPSSLGDPDRQVTPPPAPEVMHGPNADQQRSASATSAFHHLESGASLQDFFPLPGESAGSDEWAKAFTLEPSAGPGVPAPQFTNPSVQVAGKSTLWRQIPEAMPNPPHTEGMDIAHRLDKLTRQLDALTGSGTPMQSTAELFLFVAIGLLLLLAIDTLLRFASSMAATTVKSSSRSIRIRGGHRFR